MRVAVVGVGLIGGSVGLAARERRGRASSAATRPRRCCGWSAARSTPSAVVDGSAEADSSSSPRRSTRCAHVVRRALAARRGAIVTDVGSTKRALVGAIDDRRFIGGHPLAGAEAAGVEHARADLFDGATWYLTPTRDDQRRRSTSGCTASSPALGARPTAIDAARPRPADGRRLATCRTSLANVLVDRPPRRSAARRCRRPARASATRPAWPAPTRRCGRRSTRQPRRAGRRSSTRRSSACGRCASCSPATSAIEAWQTRRARRGARLLEAGWPAADATSCASSVPNRPGVVAELALALGRAGINISDMSLAPSADNRTGVVALWVPGGRAARARELIARPRDVAVTVNVRFDPSGQLQRRDHPAARQVDLATAPRCSARCASEPVRIRNYLDAADTHSTLDARARGRRARRGAPRDEMRRPRQRAARGARGGRADRRRQRRHADAPAAGLAGRAGGPRVRARRRRARSAAARRPDRRAAAR